MWLKALVMYGVVPRDGIGSACSLVFIKVHFVLKERLYCPLLFVANCCQSSVMLSGLLSRKLTIHIADNEVRRAEGGDEPTGFLCSLDVFC
jgi:hypothetical protein